jgi:hypothetical protein
MLVPPSLRSVLATMQVQSTTYADASQKESSDGILLSEC